MCKSISIVELISHLKLRLAKQHRIEAIRHDNGVIEGLGIAQFDFNSSSGLESTYESVQLLSLRHVGCLICQLSELLHIGVERSGLFEISKSVARFLHRVDRFEVLEEFTLEQRVIELVVVSSQQGLHPDQSGTAE